MTEVTKTGLRISPQDLSTVSPKGDDDDRMFHHDGSSQISTVGGGSDSERGYYLWDADAVAWYPVFRNADKIDGKEAGDFLWRDGSLAMEGDLDVGNYGLINLGSATGGTGKVDLNTNNVEILSNTSGADIRLIDSNSLLIAEAIEGGNFNIPNGQLSEQGNRVATRSWTNANADVPNADYADNANNLDGYDESAFLHVNGDQMEGVLSLGANNIEDGSDVVWDSVNEEVPQVSLGGPASSLSSYPLANSDIANSAVTVTAGNQLTGGGSVSLGGSITVDVDEGAGSGLDADTVDGDQASDLVHVAGDTMSGVLTLTNSNTQNIEINPPSGDPTVSFGHPDGGVLNLSYSKNLHADATHWLKFAESGSNGGSAGVAMSYNNSDVLPLQDANGDLGKSSNRFRNLHLSGTGYIGGNQIATQSWTNTNFYDTTQADSNFVDASGDTMGGVLDVSSNDLEDGTTTIWDTSVGEVPQAVLGGPADSLSAYPLANGDIANSSVTISPGNQLTGGGSVSLGGSITVDVNDGAGSGLDADTLDGSQKSDLDSQYLDVSGDSMEGILDVSSNDVEDGTTTIWDTSVGEVPQAVLGGPADSLNGYPLQNSDLNNSTVTVTAGNQLTGGGSVGLGGSITIDLNEGGGSGLDADTVDGDQASDLVHVAGDTMSGDLGMGENIISNLDGFDALTSRNDVFQVSDGSGGSNTTPYTFRFDEPRDFRFWSDSGTGTVLDMLHSGDIDVPGGQLSEQGDRVATRTWTNTNADVPNADYADSAGDSDTLDGEHASAFADSGHLHDSQYILEGGDTMSGVLTLSDGSTAASQSWVNGNADVPNADYADSAGDANTLDSLDSSQFLRSDSADTLTSELTVDSETKVNFGGSNYYVRYDSGRDTLVLGSAENGEMMEVDDAGNIRIEGSLTEGATIGA